MSISTEKVAYCFDKSELLYWGVREHQNLCYATLYACIEFLNKTVEQAVEKCDRKDFWKYNIVGGVIREENEVVIDYGLKVTTQANQQAVYQLYYERIKLDEMNWVTYAAYLFNRFDHEKLYWAVRGMISTNDVTTLDYEYRKKAGLL